jgi:hypothetical protein
MRSLVEHCPSLASRATSQLGTIQVSMLLCGPQKVSVQTSQFQTDLDQIVKFQLINNGRISQMQLAAFASSPQKNPHTQQGGPCRGISIDRSPTHK